MSEYEVCVLPVSKAGGREGKDSEYANRIHDEIKAAIAADRKIGVGAETRSAKARRVVDELGQGKRIEAYKTQADLLRNKQIFSDLIAQVGQKEWKNAGQALVALLSGSTRGVERANESVHVRIEGVRNQLRALLSAHELKKIPGLYESMTAHDPGFERLVMREMWRIGDDTIASSGNELAGHAASILYRAIEVSRGLMNAEGAMIGKSAHYAMRQTHDMLKISAASKDEYLAFLKERLTPETIAKIDNAGEIRGLNGWDGLYKSFSTGNFGVGAGTDFLNAFKGPGNIAKKASHERVLEFKDPDAAFEYNEKFGRAGVISGVVQNLESRAKSIGLMQKLGTNPRVMLDALINHFDSLETGAEKSIDRGKLTALYELNSGEANIPGNMTLSRWGKTLRSTQSAAKLGASVITSLADMGSFSARLRYAGVPYLQSWGAAFTGSFRRYASTEAREIQDLLAVGIDAHIRKLSQEYTAEGGIHGAIAKTADFTHRWGLLGTWVDNMTGSLAEVMARHMASFADTAFHVLPKELQTTLHQAGLSPGKWEVIRNHTKERVGDADFLYPDNIKKAPDSAVDTLIGDKIAQVRESYASHEARAYEAHAKEDTWIKNREGKLAGEIKDAGEKLAERRKKLGDRADEHINAEEVRLEKLDARYEQAVVNAEIARELNTLKTQASVRKFLDDVKVGKQPKPDMLAKVDKTIEMNIGHEASRGEKLGRKLQAIEERIKAVDAKIAAAEVHPESVIRDAVKAAGERFTVKTKELDAFVERIGKAQDERWKGVSEHEGRVEPAIERLRQKARTDLETSFRGFLVDQAKWGMTEAAPIDRYRTTWGTKSGTVLGEAVGMFSQFKQFSITFGRRGVGETLNRGPSADIGGLSHLLATTTLLGYLSLTLNDARQGKTPIEVKTPLDASKLILAAFMKGGGGGIGADLLLGAPNKSLADAVTGPVLAQVDALRKMVVEPLYRKENQTLHLGEEAYRFVKGNTPGIGLWYLSLALNQLLLNGLQEAIHPGSAQKQKENARKRGQEFYQAADPTKRWGM